MFGVWSLPPPNTCSRCCEVRPRILRPKRQLKTRRRVPSGDPRQPGYIVRIYAVRYRNWPQSKTFLDEQLSDSTHFDSIDLETSGFWTSIMSFMGFSLGTFSPPPFPSLGCQWTARPCGHPGIHCGYGGGLTSASAWKTTQMTPTDQVYRRNSKVEPIFGENIKLLVVSFGTNPPREFWNKPPPAGEKSEISPKLTYPGHHDVSPFPMPQAKTWRRNCATLPRRRPPTARSLWMESLAIGDVGWMLREGRSAAVGGLPWWVKPGCSWWLSVKGMRDEDDWT